MPQTFFKTYVNFGSFWSFKDCLEMKQKLRDAHLQIVDDEISKYVSKRRHFIIYEDHETVAISK